MLFRIIQLIIMGDYVLRFLILISFFAYSSIVTLWAIRYCSGTTHVIFCSPYSLLNQLLYEDYSYLTSDAVCEVHRSIRGAELSLLHSYFWLLPWLTHRTWKWRIKNVFRFMRHRIPKDRIPHSHSCEKLTAATDKSSWNLVWRSWHRAQRIH
jgi:hypothetical protein